MGVVVKNLPFERFTILWNGFTYYYADGVYYRSCADGTFKIVAPPVGSEVKLLPIGADIITIDNYPYYQYNGVYYESIIHPDGVFAYKIVGKDGILLLGIIFCIPII